MEFNDETPREDYTISGHTFSIIQPFAEGHVLTAGQADQLNQVLAENIRNNMAKRIKEAVDAKAFDQGEFQLAVDEYSEAYEMGERTGGGRTSDPVKQEFMLIVKDKIKAKIKSKGENLKDYKSSQITELANQYWDARETKAGAVLALAQKRVKERSEVAGAMLEDLAA